MKTEMETDMTTGLIPLALAATGSTALERQARLRSEARDERLARSGRTTGRHGDAIRRLRARLEARLATTTHQHEGMGS
jgi:hypothetical protein